MSQGHSGGYQPDLFGGQSKSYIDKNGNRVIMSQDENDRQEWENRGQANDYPHHTYKEGDSSWHYSWSRTSTRVEGMPVPNESEEEEGGEQGNGSQNLFPW
jgi:hypothetical protein